MLVVAAQGLTVTYAPMTARPVRNLEVSASLPVFRGAPLAKYATAVLKKEREQAYSAWTRDLAGDINLRPAPVPLYYNLKPTISIAQPDLISGYFTLATYSGGAHGMTNFLPFTFAHHPDGKPMRVQAKDLFLPGVDVQDVVSTEVIARLLNDPRATWIQDGTKREVSTDELEQFVVTPSGLSFLFDPYAVGPYAAGSFTVKVPFTELRPYLNPNGPLRPVLR
jgi:hypothetical protein